MNTKIKQGSILLALYVVSCILYIYYKLEASNLLALAFKPLVVILIVLYYLNFKLKITWFFLLILFLELIGDYILMYNNFESFMLGLSFFFAVNIFLILIMVQRLKVIKPKYILLFFVTSLLFIAPVVYFVFGGLGYIQILVIIFAIEVSILIAVTLYYFRENKNKPSIISLLIAILLLVLLYIFGGIARLISAKYIFKLIESLVYLLHLYFITKFILIDEQERLNN